ncbi:MAG: hypothetical protein KA994_06985, partial [Brachymonas sp.]|nr:hypothetical protein [Brachymonas sp.]
RNQANAKDQKSFPTYNVREYGGNIKAQHKKSFFVSGYKPYQKPTQSQPKAKLKEELLISQTAHPVWDTLVCTSIIIYKYIIYCCLRPVHLR